MNIWKTLAARVRGDVPATQIIPLRRAGNSIYDLLEQADDQRLQLEIQGKPAWDTGGAVQAFLASTWLAFVFYTLGDQLLVAEEGPGSSGVGFVRSGTFDLACPLFASAERELIRAEQARTNPRFLPLSQMPADLPIRLGEGRLSNAQLQGAREALRVIRSRADSLLDQLDRVKPSPNWNNETDRLRQLRVALGTRADLVERFAAGRSAPSRGLEREISALLQLYCHLGQLAANPRLIRPYARSANERLDPSTPLLDERVLDHRSSNAFLLGVGWSALVVSLVVGVFSPLGPTRPYLAPLWLFGILGAALLTFSGSTRRHAIVTLVGYSVILLVAAAWPILSSIVQLEVAPILTSITAPAATATSDGPTNSSIFGRGSRTLGPGIVAWEDFSDPSKGIFRDTQVGGGHFENADKSMDPYDWEYFYQDHTLVMRIIAGTRDPVNPIGGVPGVTATASITPNANVGFEVHAQAIKSAPQSTYGIVIDEPSRQDFAFWVAPGSRQVGVSSPTDDKILAVRNSIELGAADSPNDLQVDLRGDEAQFRINGATEATVRDPAFAEAGETVGLFTGMRSLPPGGEIEVHFANFVISDLSGGSSR